MHNYPQYVNEFIKKITLKNPNELEFLQAVGEVAEDILPFIHENPEYDKGNLFESMCEPERIFIFRVPWVDDKGNTHINRGYRVQMNSAIGPYKGGLRFHPSVNLSILKFLAFEQVFKNSLTTLPLGGGKGGSDFDPKGKSDVEIMRFCQSFMSELYKYIGGFIDIPAGDIGVGSREIGYLFGQYKRLKGEFNGVITGKGLAFGGSMIRPEATGYGCVYFSQEMLHYIQEDIKNKVCVISGSGNVAQFTAEKLLQLNAKVIAMSDSSGTIHDPEGINNEKLKYIKHLKNIKRKRISEYIQEYPHAKFHEKRPPWFLTCDLAYPSATQNELLLEDAKMLISNGCQGVFEGANMPCSKDSINYIKENNILYSPGKASNAGGVATSGLEMSQNAQRLVWTREEVDNQLHRIMANIHTNCVKHGKRKDGHIDYGKGANVAGFVKVADAMMAQGCV